MSRRRFPDQTPIPEKRVVVLQCEKCGGTVSTISVQVYEPVPGIRKWVGVPCSGCDVTYTIEEEWYG